MTFPLRNFNYDEKIDPNVFINNPKLLEYGYGIKDKHFVFYEKLGDYLYELKFKKKSLTDINNKDKNKVLVIKNCDDYLKFYKKYIHNYYILMEDKFKKDYAALEIINVKKIFDKLNAKKQLDHGTYIFMFFSFDRGMIFNPDVIESITYVRKVSKKEINILEKKRIDLLN